MNRHEPFLKKRKAYFRADSSTIIGTGHIMRCLALANVLFRDGFEIAFICRALAGNISGLIKDKGYDVHIIGEETGAPDNWDWRSDSQNCRELLAAEDSQADLLVVDSYKLDREWEKLMRAYVRKVMVIDDLADRAHDCDILLDQNYLLDGRDRYKGLVPPDCKLLLGPRFIILRAEFLRAKANIKARGGIISRIFMFYGGGDMTNETAKAVQSLIKASLEDVDVDIVIGESNPYKTEIAKAIKNHPNFALHIQAKNIGEIMANADLALGAGGINTWERCFLGLPAIVTAVADNQIPSLQSLAFEGAVLFLGEAAKVNQGDIIGAIRKVTANPELLAKMSEAGLSVMARDPVCSPEELLLEAINA